MFEIDKCVTCDVDTSNTTPGLTNKLDIKNATRAIVPTHIFLPNSF